MVINFEYNMTDLLNSAIIQARAVYFLKQKGDAVVVDELSHQWKNNRRLVKPKATWVDMRFLQTSNPMNLDGFVLRVQ